MGRSTRVLLIDDYAPLRRLVRATLQEIPELQIVGEAADGLEAVQKFQKLHPNLVVIDVGLPALNGIEAARRMRESAPGLKILFVSENYSWQVAEEAFRAGASGYVVKSDIARDLLVAVKSVIAGRRFVSTSLARPSRTAVPSIAHHHEAGFYSDDHWLLEDVTQFIGTVLWAGNSALVVAEESKRKILTSSLRAFGIDIGAAIDESRYIALDAHEALAGFMVHGMPDPVRFNKGFGDLVTNALMAAKNPHPRVGLFGELAPLLCAEGHSDAAIQLEKLANLFVDRYDVDLLCGYSLSMLQGQVDQSTLQAICAQHASAQFY